MDLNEEYVRSKWVSVYESVFQGLTGITLCLGGNYFLTEDTRDCVMKSAAAFNRAHEQKIADVSEEISEHEAIQVLGGDAPMKRTLARLESVKAELLKGWKA